MPDNSFAERFKRLEPIDLITILSTADDYRPEAVEAAQKELVSRGLSEEELNQLRNSYNEKIAAAQAKDVKWRQLKEKAETAAHDFSPVQFGPQSQDKYIRSITIFAAMYFLFMLYRSLSFFEIYFGESALDRDWVFFEAAIPLVWLPLAGILFGLKRKAGWLLMFAYFWKVAFGSIALMLYFGQVMMAAQSVIAALIFAVACYAMMRKNLRETFKANNSVLGTAIALGSLGALLPLILFYMFE